MRAKRTRLVVFWLMERDFITNCDGAGTDFFGEQGKRHRDERPGDWSRFPTFTQFRVSTQTNLSSGVKMVGSDGSDSVKIVLEPFARGSIEDRFGPDLCRGSEAALRHYARRVRSRRRPPEVPLFMCEVDVDRSEAIELELSLPYEVQSALTREARLQGVRLDRIVAHAIFVYLSDVEAGPGSWVEDAKEDGVAPRYTEHAARQLSSTRRPRGTPAGGRTLWRGRGAGGRSRFGQR